ncbi:MAG: DUF5698 domain-containing protein [Gemmatimonadota bacterium]
MTVEALFSGPFGPLLIFGLRVVDVSMATMRTLLIVRGARRIVPVIGFFEALIWVLAVGSAIRHLDSVWHILGYGAGFATGNLVGLLIEDRIALGVSAIQAISPTHGGAIADALRAEGLGATQIGGYGLHGPVGVVQTVVQRRQVRHVLDVLRRIDPEAFVTVEEPRSIQRGWMFPYRRK